jgi:hypothetical protein
VVRTRAPGDEHDVVAQTRRSTNEIDDDAAHDPCRVGRLTRVEGVVAGDVLQHAGDGVETQPPSRIHVAKPYAHSRFEEAAPRGPTHELVSGHAGNLACSGFRAFRKH